MISVADLHPDLSFHVDADPDLTFHFDVDQDLYPSPAPTPAPAPLKYETNLRPLVYRPSTTPF